MKLPCTARVVITLLAFQTGLAFGQTDPSRISQNSRPAPGVYNNENGSPLVALIKSATKSIDIEIYKMENAVFINSLREALKRGVTIRMIKEPRPLGDPCHIFPEFDSPSTLPLDPPSPSCVNQMNLKREILAKGGAFIPFNKAELCGDGTKSCFLHGKLIIVDQRTALISTGNFNDSNLCDLTAVPLPLRCNRDYSMITNEPLVIDSLLKIVNLDLKSRRYDLKMILSNPAIQEKLTVSPLSLQPLVDFIDSSTRTLNIQNQYLNDLTINQAILRAAARGVKVNLMVASTCAFDIPTPKKIESIKKLFNVFDAAGIFSRMFTTAIKVRGVDGYLHAKVIVVDGKRAWVGSVNGSTTAVSSNREFGLFTSDPNDLKLLNFQLNSDQRNPQSESWSESNRCLKDTLPPKSTDQ